MRDMTMIAFFFVKIWLQQKYPLPLPPPNVTPPPQRFEQSPIIIFIIQSLPIK